MSCQVTPIKEKLHLHYIVDATRGEVHTRNPQVLRQEIVGSKSDCIVRSYCKIKPNQTIVANIRIVPGFFETQQEQETVF